jgi:hypothetical protein
MEEKQNISASMFPQVAKLMMTAIKNHDLSEQQLGAIIGLCHDVEGMAKAERERMRAKQSENKEK